MSTSSERSPPMPSRTVAAAVLQPVGELRVCRRPGGALGVPGGDERRRGELLDHPVVQRAGDPAALVVGGVERAPHQLVSRCRWARRAA